MGQLGWELTKYSQEILTPRALLDEDITVGHIIKFFLPHSLVCISDEQTKSYFSVGYVQREEFSAKIVVVVKCTC